MLDRTHGIEERESEDTAGVLGDGAEVHGSSPEKVCSNPLSEHLPCPPHLLGRLAE